MNQDVKNFNKIKRESSRWARFKMLFVRAYSFRLRDHLVVVKVVGGQCYLTGLIKLREPIEMKEEL